MDYLSVKMLDNSSKNDSWNINYTESMMQQFVLSNIFVVHIFSRQTNLNWV